MSSVNDIRTAFLEYFGKHGHEIVDLSLLVPQNDLTLMFTNAGMVQFKNLFTGLETRGYNRAVTSQKCVRAGGNQILKMSAIPRVTTPSSRCGNFSLATISRRTPSSCLEPGDKGIRPGQGQASCHGLSRG